MVFRGCACATIAFPQQTPLHDDWESDLWAKTVSEARKELLQRFKREAASSALADVGITDRFMKELATVLIPSRSALFVLTRRPTPDGSGLVN